MDDPAQSVAFLLSRLGVGVSAAFAESLHPIGLEPREAGLLRAIAAADGRSQLELSERLGVQPSRMVTLLDDLEARGLVERQVNPTDRRARVVHLTRSGARVLERVNAVGARHEARVCAPLTPGQRAQLLELLQLVATGQDGPIDAHPGIGRPSSGETADAGSVD